MCTTPADHPVEPGAPAARPGQATLDHTYDGIQEYDNPQPGWWTLLFALTAVWSAVYLAYYHVGVGESIQDEYRTEVARRLKEQAALPGFEPTEEGIIGLSRDPAALAAASQRFQTTCAACHAADGGGGVGPNLTDRWWLHGGDPLAVYRTIHDGVPEKGMLRWADTIPPAEIAGLAGYVLSLQGTRPKAPKAPEGALAEEK